jgi:hypothetical protein
MPAPAPPATERPETSSGEEHPDEKEKDLDEEAGRQEAARDSDTLRNRSTGMPSAGVQVNLTVDSSSDPDKLEKQLKLLKQFGLLRP